MAGGGPLGGDGEKQHDKQHAKRKRLDREGSRTSSGQEGLTPEDLRELSTPYDAQPNDSDTIMQTFTAQRLASEAAGPGPGSAASARALGRAGAQETRPGTKKEKPPEDGSKARGGALAAGVGIVEPEEADAMPQGAYMAREENLRRLEEAGKLLFTAASNDGNVQHMIWLIGLKNIFSRQLPNMPKEYIVRLVMDRNHKSVMIVKQNQVVGGITYRPYKPQRFGEIAFCAITASEQVKGYGTRLMNHLKQHARDADGLEYFLTYADNNAVGYFSKQGFTKEITMEKDRWFGYIKDYDGGTLMECFVHPKLPFIEFPLMLKRQKQAIDEKIRELSNQHLVYPGLDVWKKAGYGRAVMRIEDIPGIKDAGWVADSVAGSRVRLVSASGDGPPTKQSMHAFMRSVLRSLVDHPDSWPFKEPVDGREVPDYYDIIKNPMDLKTISKRLDGESYYITLEIFRADVRRIFDNARTYNAPDTIYYKGANRLEQFFNTKLQAGVQAARPSVGQKSGLPQSAGVV